MDALTDEQKFQIIDNFVRKCAICKRQLDPLSGFCTGCRKNTPMSDVFPGSYVEHFDIRTCDILKDSAFFYCVHPSKTCTLEELHTHCVHCITGELLQKDLVVVKDGQFQWNVEKPKPDSSGK